MAKLGDRVKETSPTLGTGTLELAGAPTGFRAFADEFTSGQTEIPYLCVDDVDNPTQYEYGYGTFTNASPDTFARDTVKGSSNGGSKVSWLAGCTIVVTPNADWANTLGGLFKVAAKTGAYTVTANDRGRTINATSGTWTLTLLAAATAGDGFLLAVRNSGTGVVTIDGNASETIDGATTLALAAGDSLLLVCNGSNWLTVGRSVTATPMAGALFGLTLSAAGGSATFGIAAGSAADSTNAALMTLASACTKTTSAWAVGSGNGGLDTGSIANSTWYHVYLIKRPDTGVVDVIFSTSASAPTLPTNYTLYRRIGSIRTNGSAQWIKFSQLGDEFLWDVMTADVAVTNLGTTGTLYTLTVPTGVKVNALFRASFKNAAVDVGGFISSPDESDQTVSVAAGKSHFVVSVAGKYVANAFNIRTNTSAQIRAISDTASSTLNISTYGWIDRRGRDA